MENEKLYRRTLSHNDLYNSKEAAKPVVDTIKQVIKDKKADSTCKLMALKLLHRCVLENQSPEFMIYMEKKIMSRLAILARHKKV
jgi:hypothetical protein